MSIIGHFFRLLFYPLSASVGIINRVYIYFSSWASTSRRHLASDPASVADRWVRELEEETGAIRESRLSDYDDGVASSSGAQAKAGPGPSTLSRRNESSRAYRKQLPEFYLGSYESALQEAQREVKLLLAVIVSEEHDDVPEFKRTTLVDSEFNKLLKDNNFIVWGGDVRDYEASQASQKLGATTYPFVAFIGLQPRTGPRGSSNAPILTVLSRHQGPATSVDSDAPSPTSARALCAHLTDSLLPRVNPFLARLRNQHLERLTERRLREEQDAAFARSAQADAERIMKKRQEEERQREEIEMQEIQRAIEESKKEREIEEREEREANRLLWYRYARRNLLPQEAAPGKDSLRVGIRMPDGRLHIRHFSHSDTVTSLYVAVASQLISKDLPSSEDPELPPTGFQAGEAGINDDSWSFKLASSYPRREVPWTSSTLLTEVDGLRGGGQLVVESIPGHALIPGNGNADDNSDYDTEEE